MRQKLSGPRRRKTLDIHQRLLDSARKVLGTTTETETVRVALERVLHKERVIDSIEALRGIRFDRSRLEE